ncbi:MAG: oligosaccharide flippase family protein [Pedobacter sp.]|jgi:O-antigen/teichoic acid export membrane protein|uniref:oligosaccharide flippase family protein n=1 Tax=Pedobacter sp. TaxID=1411316 RepID=UPI003566533D
MENKKNSYQQIFKATSIFGGVQVVNILILVIRSKFIAVLLGPAGMGVASLLISTTNFLSSLTHFGLGSSAVKNVAVANGTGDEHKLGQTIAVFRKLVWITGMFGFILALALSPLLSKIAFGNNKYTISFMLISVTLLLTQISDGQTVLLRGTRNIKLMAKASMIGALMGLLISIPLYYFFGQKGITPSIILTAVSGLCVTWFYSKKIKIKKVQTNKQIIVSEGLDMLKMGVLISMSSLISMGTSYIVRIFISSMGGISDVGLYNAGFAIIGTYVGLVFTAMSTDYYPRLAAVANDNKKCREEINQQAEVALLILAPILIIFLVFIDFAIILLYSKEFIAITSMVHWAAIAIFFKATSWAIGIIFISKGATKLFFWNELITNTYLLGLNILGYYFFGLTGLGVSFLIGYILHLVQMYIVTNRLYGFTFDSKFIKIFLFQFLLAIACFISVSFLQKNLSYLIGICFITISMFFSWKEMNKRIDLNLMLSKILLKKIKK